jgi:rare lipoprotein A
LKTGNSVIVRINNRGPFVRGRIIDLSVAAAKKLGSYDRGLAKVRIEALRKIPLLQKSNLKALKPPKPPELKTELKPAQKSKAKEKARAFGWRVSRPDEICVEEKDRQMSMKKLNYAGEKEFNTVQ